VHKNNEFKKYEDQLEGIITLNSKVGKNMDEPEKKKENEKPTEILSRDTLNKLENTLKDVATCLEKNT